MGGGPKGLLYWGWGFKGGASKSVDAEYGYGDDQKYGRDDKFIEIADQFVNEVLFSFHL